MVRLKNKIRFIESFEAQFCNKALDQGVNCGPQSKNMWPSSYFLGQTRPLKSVTIKFCGKTIKKGLIL